MLEFVTADRDYRARFNWELSSTSHSLKIELTQRQRRIVMNFAKAFGVCIFLFSVSLVLAGGIGIPKKEDVPKYLAQLKESKVAADRAKAAEMLGKRGGVSANDVEDAVEPL